MNHRKIFSESTTVLTLRTLALFDYGEVSVYSPSQTVTEVITVWDTHTHTRILLKHTHAKQISNNLKIVRILIPLLFCVFCAVLLQTVWMTSFFYSLFFMSALCSKHHQCAVLFCPCMPELWFKSRCKRTWMWGGRDFRGWATTDSLEEIKAMLSDFFKVEGVSDSQLPSGTGVLSHLS